MNGRIRPLHKLKSSRGTPNPTNPLNTSSKKTLPHRKQRVNGLLLVPIGLRAITAASNGHGLANMSILIQTGTLYGTAIYTCWSKCILKTKCSVSTLTKPDPAALGNIKLLRGLYKSHQIFNSKTKYPRIFIRGYSINRKITAFARVQNVDIPFPAYRSARGGLWLGRAVPPAPHWCRIY